MIPKRRIEKVMDLEVPDRVPFDGVYPHRSDMFYMPLAPAHSWQPEDQPGVYPNVDPIVTTFKGWRWRPSNWTPPDNWRQVARTAIDEFGSKWQYLESDPTKGYPIGSDLTEWDQLDAWKFPDPYDPSHYRPFARFKALFPRKYKIGILDSFLFARHQYLRGFMPSVTDYLKSPSAVKDLMAKLQEYFVGVIEMWHKFGAQAVYTMDDMGTQKGGFISPRMYGKFILPAFKAIVERAHDFDMKFVLHSCGHVNEYMPLWVDIGVDALQFDSPHMTGLEFDAKYVGKIGFHVVPDIQEVYPFASVGELEEEVKKMIRILGREGGLIIRDYDGAEQVLQVPHTNVKALPKIVKKWGQYPLSWA